MLMKYIVIVVVVVLSLCLALVRPGDIGLNVAHPGVGWFEGCECQDDIIER